MEKARRNGSAMVVVTVLVMMTGGILSGATENVSGATEVDLYAGGVTTSSVELTWTETQDWLFDHYEVYMNDGDGWRLMKTFQSKHTLECTVTGLESDTTYNFLIRDVDELGHADSNVVMITTESESIPALPVTGVLVAIVGAALVVSARKKKKGEEAQEGQVKQEGEHQDLPSGEDHWAAVPRKYERE